MVCYAFAQEHRESSEPASQILMQLLTERLLLREANRADANELNAYQTDSRYLEHYATAPDAEEIVRLATAWAKELPRLNFQLIIETRESRDVIGCVGLRIDTAASTRAEVGIEIAPDDWRLGFASESLSCIEEFAISIGLTELIANTRQSNNRSRALLASLGFSVDTFKGEDVILAKHLTE